MKKKILIAIAVLLVGIQFIRIDTNNPDIDPTKDFLNIASAPEDVTLIMKNACYDCHSNETAYPWYSQIAPVSWWLKDHINEGRRHLNFSIWGEYETKRQSHKLEECIEEVEHEEMPLNSYTWMHGDARLSDTEKEKLNAFFQEVRGGIVVEGED